MLINKKKLRNFLNFYWLRPENAIVKYFQSYSWSDIHWKGKSIDISTGDGSYVFLHCGGEFDEKFDFYIDTKSEKFSHKKFIDIYDSFSKKYKPIIKKRPTKKFTIGTDWKDGLISKANSLNFFEKTLKHDNNFLPFPFHDNEFKFIHSNSLYWTNNPIKLLKDVNRILDKDGLAVLEFSTKNMLSTLYDLKPILSKSAFDILDRKRTLEMKGIKGDINDWIDYIKKSNLKIEEIRWAWPNKIITDFWNTGLRPISHLLIKMANKMSTLDRKKIKQEWVNIFYEILLPLSIKPKTYNPKKASYVTFILRKK